jgi:hypothetical protein
MFANTQSLWSLVMSEMTIGMLCGDKSPGVQMGKYRVIKTCSAMVET